MYYTWEEVQRLNVELFFMGSLITLLLVGFYHEWIENGGQ